MAEWSEVSPPAPPPTSASSSKEAAVSLSYVNFNPGSKGAKQRMGNGLDQQIYVPGCYMVSMMSFLAM